MATVPEDDDTFPEGVYRIETTDPVLGGPPNEATGAGLINIPLMHLAKRTRWLKARVVTLLENVQAASLTVVGIVKLSSSTSSTSNTEAATPSAVKAAMDNANTRALSTRSISAGGLATGGGDLSADRTITVPIATQADGEAGLINDRAMTPLRVAQAIAKKITDGAMQAGSSILSAISGLAANGLIVRTAAGTVASRSITAGTGVAVTNGDGVTGNPSVALTGQTLALHNLAANGVVTRTAAGAFAVRTLTGGTGITVTNGDGVGGNPTFALNGQAAALDILAVSGLIVRTGLDTVAARTITGSNGVIVTNGNGVLAGPAITLNRYQSADLTITNLGLITLTHGLGVEPFLVTLALTCVVAEHGYAVGDIVEIAGIDADTDSVWEGVQVRKSATQLVLRVGNNGPGEVCRKDTGAIAVATSANWKLIVGAMG